MVKSQISRRIQQAAYLERSKSAVEQVLSQRDVQSALGSSAARLLTLARGLYVPDVLPEGLVTLHETNIQSDALPAVMLRDNEHARRDHTFATFTPQQHVSAPPDQAVYFDTISSRILADPEETFIAQTSGQNAAVVRMMYSVPRHPTPHDITYFNLRPLILLRYYPVIESVKPAAMVCALAMADLVLENPVTVVPSGDAFDELNTSWVLAGEEAGQIVASLDQAEA